MVSPECSPLYQLIEIPSSIPPELTKARFPKMETLTIYGMPAHLAAPATLGEPPFQISIFNLAHSLHTNRFFSFQRNSLFNFISFGFGRVEVDTSLAPSTVPGAPPSRCLRPSSSFARARSPTCSRRTTTRGFLACSAILKARSAQGPVCVAKGVAHTVSQCQLGVMYASCDSYLRNC